VRWAVALVVGAGCGGGTGDSGEIDAPSELDGRVDANGHPYHWQPTPGTSWQWQLDGTIDTTVDAMVYDVDLFDTPQAVIDELHAAGRKVICYFDTAYEPGRPDSALLEPYRGNPIQGWPGQFWLDFREPAVREVMRLRINLARNKQCDGVEPDDVDAIDNNPGFPLTAADQLDFCTFLATRAHEQVLAVGLKNNLAQIPDLLPLFDFAINEECFVYNECDDLLPFIAANKPVWNAEYGNDLETRAAEVCPDALARNFDTIVKHLDLDAPRVSCR
jgi:hypothetical protein